MRAAWPVVLVLACVPAAAFAQAPADAPAAAIDRAVDYRVVEPPATGGLFHAGPTLIYLNRCRGGCAVRAGTDDAVGNTSSILGRDGIPAQVSIEEFSWDQPTWDAVVQCVRDTYAIYGATVVTDPPAGPHVEVMVAGTAAALALPSNTLGIAPLANDCSRLPSAVAFAFANAHPQGETQIEELCATAAHEAGHVFGLDHEFDCRDPMTYLTGCGPKIFLNRTVACGEFDGPRPCRCAATQSSHQHLTEVLGPGAAPTPARLSVPSPMAGATVPATFSVFVGVSGRPAASVELWANRTQLAEVPGKSSSAPYELRTSASVPDGVLDLEVRAYDDLGQLATTTLQVTKGAPCTSASTCPSGWSCDAGRCLAPAGTAQLGEGCTADTDCAGGQCGARGGERTCTRPCWPADSSCGGGLSCLAGDDEGYACFAEDAGGCCSAGGDPRGALGLGALTVLGLARRRRRDRRLTRGTDRS